MKSNGKVFLVGAGPGAPDLLTLRALKLMGRADIVLYDRLVNPDILRHAPHAEHIFVGKALGADSRVRQERIFTLMIGHARLGKTVIRLKGGDPFVFGRGGEEMLKLRSAGIAVEVVPGISSSIYAPQSAMIPVTFRGIASSYGVFAGHPGDSEGSRVDWVAAARIQTAVFLMGVAKLPVIVGNLLAQGRSPQTPVALIEKASLPGQKVVTGTLADILAKSGQVEPPTTIVVGEVVGMASHGTLAQLPPLEAGETARENAS